jgi:surfeit locus 1 family protein
MATPVSELPSRRGRSSVVLIATVVGVAATSALGTWQLNRAAQKLSMQAALEARSALPELTGNELARNAAAALPQHYQRARLKGQWIAAHTVFLDNRQMNDKPGFFVITPLKLSGSDQAVLVQRGWSPRNFLDRAALPSVPTPSGEVEVMGQIAPPPARLFEFAGAVPGPLRQNLDVVAFAQEVATPLLPMSILQVTSDTQKVGPDGLQRQWPVPETGIHKHHGYAFQWFALSALLAGLYVWFQLVVPRLRLRSFTDKSQHD